MKLKEESEKAGLKFNIQKTKIMASGPITSWQIVEETMETVTDFIFLGSKITADGDFWSHHFMENRWGNNGNSERLYFLWGSKISADGDCSHRIKRHLLFG